MVFYGYQTHSRNEVWSSSLTLWEDSVAHSGTWRSHLNYALALEDVDRADEALIYFQKAVELGPYAVTNTNLGLAYIKRGNSELGLRHLRTATELLPDSADAHRYLAYGLQTIGHMDEAEAELKRAIALQANYIDAYAELAVLYELRQRPDLAADAYRRILEIDPAERWAEEKLAALDHDSASLRDAWDEIEREQYQKALEILEPAYRETPNDPEVLFALGFAHQMRDDREQAAQVYEQLLVVAPDHRQGTFNLAFLYLHGDSGKDWSRCVILFEHVLEIDPEYVEALFHLATAHRQLNNMERAAEYDREYIERGDHEDLIERSRKRLENGGI
jgi:superkiller protein 3